MDQSRIPQKRQELLKVSTIAALPASISGAGNGGFLLLFCL
jgi:galactokinase/mevalonate kinase-like predicted kinase